MKGLRGILDDSVKEVGGRRRAEEQGCIELWPAVVGSGIADATRADRLRNGVLIVVTRTSVWACELALRKPEIMQAMNDRFGRPLVEDIRFKVGALVPSTGLQTVESAEAQSPSAGVQIPEVPISDRLKAQVERAILSIGDDRIRERTRTVLMREAQKREHKQSHGWKECPRCGTLHPEGHRLCPLCRLRIRT